MRGASRRSWLALAAAAIALSGGGCASIDVVMADRMHDQRFTGNGRPIAHIRATNWGWYFLKFVPIWTGNIGNPEYPQFCYWFTDNVSVEDVVRMVTAKAKELGGTRVIDLTTTDKSDWQPETIFFWLNEIEVSASVVAD